MLSWAGEVIRDVDGARERARDDDADVEGTRARDFLFRCTGSAAADAFDSVSESPKGELGNTFERSSSQTSGRPCLNLEQI